MAKIIRDSFTRRLTTDRALLRARAHDPRRRTRSSASATASVVARIVFCGGVVAGILTAGVARATPTFPRTVARHLGSEATPTCATCHDGPTRKGTVTTPVGAALRARGLVAHDETSLLKALDTSRADKQDSDGDGAIDVEELRTGASPNVASPSADPGLASEEAGCQLTPSSRSWGHGATAPMILLLAVLLIARVGSRGAPAARASAR